jgi:hypothetical protein
MNVPIITHLLHLIEEIFKADAPSVEKAVGVAALAAAEQDPKVEAVTAASVALLAAAQNLKVAMKADPEAAAATPTPQPEPAPETHAEPAD